MRRPPSLEEETRGILRAYELRPRKALGQNFLVDEEVLAAIIEAADIRPDETILEIGPGIGVLTRELARFGARIVSIELDEDLAASLRPRFATRTNVEIVHGNALHMDLRPLLGDRGFKVVANIPYYITAPIVRHFLAGPLRPDILVLMVQREVAERLAAAPGDLSLLGIVAQFYAEVEIVRIVEPASFFPPPQVQSAVVRLVRRPVAPVEVDDPERLFRTVKAGFGSRRKQVHNALARGLAHIPSRIIDETLSRCEIERTRRAETLSLEEWARLHRAVREIETAGAAASSGDA